MSKGKGDRRERQAVEIYEGAGYAVETPNYTRYGDTDFFNCFDLLAIAQGRRPRLVQVKSNRAKGIQSWVADTRAYHAPTHLALDFAVCHDREGWRLLQPADGGYETVVDERDEDCSMGEGLTEYLSTEDSQ